MLFFADVEDTIKECIKVLPVLLDNALAYRGHQKPWKDGTYCLAVFLRAGSVGQIPEELSSPSARLTKQEAKQQLDALLADPISCLMREVDKIVELVEKPSPEIIAQANAVREQIIRNVTTPSGPREKTKRPGPLTAAGTGTESTPAPASTVAAKAARIKAKLREAVEKSPLTQEEIGVRMGISKSSARAAVCQILNQKNNPRLKTLVTLAEVLNLSIDLT